MESRRILSFMIAILIGIAAGLAVGWFIKPLPVRATTPDSLRADYKADYVLMTAEIYAQEASAPLAERRLAPLGADSSLRAIQEAILTGRGLNYSQGDILTMARLAQALSGSKP
jgi:hypothetical protein